MSETQPHLIDTHAHLDDRQFDLDRDEVIKHAQQTNVDVILMSIHPGNIDPIISLARSCGYHCAVGVHPNATDLADDGLESLLKSKVDLPEVVAIGEIGLDYYRDNVTPDVQKEVLRRQLALALELDLPVVLHNREATSDLLGIIKEFSGIKGVWHSFMGTVEEAQSFLELGFYLGIGGPITFNKNEVLRETVKQLPIDRLLVETDSPYLTPAPHRGKRNESAYVRHVAEKLAEVKEMSIEAVAEQTTANARTLFQF
jgi:TatD DNase family protein